MEVAEKMYSVKEVAAELGIGTVKTLMIIKKEPGVLNLNAGTGQRPFWRIPQHVLDRIKRRSANPSPPPVLTRASA